MRSPSASRRAAARSGPRSTVGGRPEMPVGRAEASLFAAGAPIGWPAACARAGAPARSPAWPDVCEDAVGARGDGTLDRDRAGRGRSSPRRTAPRSDPRRCVAAWSDTSNTPSRNLAVPYRLQWKTVGILCEFATMSKFRWRLAVTETLYDSVDDAAIAYQSVRQQHSRRGIPPRDKDGRTWQEQQQWQRTTMQTKEPV